MFDFIFDGFMAFNLIGFFIGGLVMAGIGALLLGDWLLWEIKSKRVKAKIVAVKSTGTRRSDAEWEKEYAGSSVAKEEQGPDGETFKAELKKNPLSFAPAFLLILLLFIVPVVFMGFGGYMVADYVSLKSSGILTSARVTEIDSYRDSDSGTMYRPVIEFKDGSGVSHTYKDRVSTGGKPDYDAGERVSIYYDPEKPSRFMIDSFWRYAGLGLVFFAAGAAVFILFFGRLVLRLAGVDKRIPEDEALSKAIEKIKRQNIQNQHYIAVYEFTGPDGDIRRMDEGQPNNWLADKLPGRSVTLLLRPDKPDEVRRPGMLLLFFGLMIFCPGAFLLHMSLTEFTWSPGSMAIVAAALAFCAWKLRGMIKEMESSRAEYLAAKAQRKAGKKAEKKKRKAENGYEMTPLEIRARMKLLDRQALFTVPVVLFFGVGLIVGGLQLNREMTGLAARGVSATGEIVSIESRRSSDGKTMYHAVIGFETTQGRSVRFQDKTGSSAPTRRTGTQVKVLYDAENPDNAIIDRGFLNWVWPGLLTGFGLLMVWWSVRMLAGVALRAGRI